MTTNTTIPTTNTTLLAPTTTTSSYVINTVDLYGQSYDIGMTEEAFAEAMEKYMQKRKPVFYKLTCQGCGASLNQKVDDHIVKCPYCRSAYAIGTKMVNMR